MPDPAEAREAATIEEMRPDDWPAVRRIYEEGIATGSATFETNVPSWEAWDAHHRPGCRHRRPSLRLGRRVGGTVALFEPVCVRRRGVGERLRGRRSSGHGDRPAAPGRDRRGLRAGGDMDAPRRRAGLQRDESRGPRAGRIPAARGPGAGRPGWLGTMARRRHHGAAQSRGRPRPRIVRHGRPFSRSSLLAAAADAR